MTQSTDPTPDPDAPTFEAALAELESIVGGLERGELTLDESVRAFERGTGLLRILTARLDDAERRVRELVEGPDGITETPADGGPRS